MNNLDIIDSIVPLSLKGMHLKHFSNEEVISKIKEDLPDGLSGDAFIDYIECKLLWFKGTDKNKKIADKALLGA